MRDPFFRILDVTEARGRSIADIAAEVAGRRQVSLNRLRGRQQDEWARKARHEAILQIKAERPDLSSAVVSQFFGREASVIRRLWRNGAVA